MQSILIMKITELFNSIIDVFYSKVLISLFILIIGFILGNLFKKFIYSFLNYLKINILTKKIFKKQLYIEENLSWLASTTIYFTAVIYSLYKLGIAEKVINIILFVVFFLLILSLLISVKDLFPNFFAGIYLLLKHNLKKGTIIKIDKIKGKIITLGFLETVLKTNENETIVIPNSLLLKNEFILRAENNKKIRFLAPPFTAHAPYLIIILILSLILLILIFIILNT